MDMSKFNIDFSKLPEGETLTEEQIAANEKRMEAEKEIKLLERYLKAVERKASDKELLSIVSEGGWLSLQQFFLYLTISDKLEELRDELSDLAQEEDYFNLECSFWLNRNVVEWQKSYDSLNAVKAKVAAKKQEIKKQEQMIYEVKNCYGLEVAIDSWHNKPFDPVALKNYRERRRNALDDSDTGRKVYSTETPEKNGKDYWFCHKYH